MNEKGRQTSLWPHGCHHLSWPSGPIGRKRQTSKLCGRNDVQNHCRRKNYKRKRMGHKRNTAWTAHSGLGSHGGPWPPIIRRLEPQRPCRRHKNPARPMRKLPSHEIIEPRQTSPLPRNVQPTELSSRRFLTPISTWLPQRNRDWFQWNVYNLLPHYRQRVENKDEKGGRPAHQTSQRHHYREFHFPTMQTGNHQPTQNISVHPSRQPKLSHTIPQGSYHSMQSDDSAQSAGESQNKYQEEDHFWDQTEDTYIKSEFDPGPYNTDGLHPI